MATTPFIQKAEFPFPGMARNAFQVFRVFFSLRERYPLEPAEIEEARSVSAQELGLRDRVLLRAEYALLEELVELAQLVRQGVAGLNLDWKRNVRSHDEIIASILDFDVSPEGDVI